MTNSWIEHVKQVQKEHNIGYGEALQLAKHSYKSGGSVASDTVARIWKYNKQGFDIHKIKNPSKYFQTNDDVIKNSHVHIHGKILKAMKNEYKNEFQGEIEARRKIEEGRNELNKKIDYRKKENRGKQYENFVKANAKIDEGKEQINKLFSFRKKLLKNEYDKHNTLYVNRDKLLKSSKQNHDFLVV